MIVRNEVAERMACDIGRNGLSLSLVRQQSEACEKRREEHRKGGPHYCPSYVYCLMGRSSDIWGHSITMPVCPTAVLIEHERFRGQVPLELTEGAGI